MTNRMITWVLFLSCSASAWAQPEPPPTVELQKVAPGVAMLSGNGGNIGVSYGKDGTLLIDDQFAPATPAILEAVSTLTDEPVRFVVNTHWHFDHTGGNENFGAAGAVIVAHENVRKRMSTDQFMKALDRKIPASPPDALPVVTFTTDVTLHSNGDSVHVRHVPPAHTDGDSFVRFDEANVVHTGDVYNNTGYPFIDLSSGGSAAGLLQALEGLLPTLDDETSIIPGHGPLATKEDLAQHVHMLRSVLGKIRAKLDQGASTDEIVASKPTADFDAKYGHGFIKPDFFVSIVSESLASQHDSAGR